jgi:hypothetical protein
VSCERNRSEIREVSLGAAPSRRLEAHLASCAVCRAILEEDRRRLAEIDDELGQALAVEPSASLLTRAREVVARGAGPRTRLVWLLPVAASIVALAALLPPAKRMLTGPLTRPASPSPATAAAEPALSPPETPVAVSRPQPREGTGREPVRTAAVRRRAPVRTARAGAEPEVIVPPGGEAALRRYVEAVGHSRVVGEVVLGPGPDPVDWAPPASMRQPPRTVERFPGDMEAPMLKADTLTSGD